MREGASLTILRKDVAPRGWFLVLNYPVPLLEDFPLRHDLGYTPNHVIALRERFLIALDVPLRYQDHYRAVVAKLTSYLRPRCHTWTYERVLQTCPVKNRRKYKRAYESLKEHPKILPRDRRTTLMIKDEMVVTKKKDPPGRCVVFHNQRLNMMLMRFIKAMEEHAYRMSGSVLGNPSVHRSFFVGLNSYEAASLLRRKWNRFANPVFIGMDCSRWDAHVSTTLKKILHAIYKGVFASRELNRILNVLMIHRFRNRRLKGKCPGSVNSGAADTTLGNNLLVFVILSTIVQRCRLSKVEEVIAGDDCGLIIEKSDLERVIACSRDVFTDAGHEVKFECVTDKFEEILFCQKQPVLIQGTWKLVRGHEKVMPKMLGLTDKVFKQGAAVHYLYTKAVCEYITSRGVPVVQGFCLAVMHRCVALNPRVRANLAHFDDWQGINVAREARRYGIRVRDGVIDTSRLPEPINIDANTRDSYFRAFACSPSMQTSFEDHCSRWEFDLDNRAETPVEAYEFEPWRMNFDVRVHTQAPDGHKIPRPHYITKFKQILTTLPNGQRKERSYQGVRHQK